MIWKLKTSFSLWWEKSEGAFSHIDAAGICVNARYEHISKIRQCGGFPLIDSPSSIFGGATEGDWKH